MLRFVAIFLSSAAALAGCSFESGLGTDASPAPKLSSRSARLEVVAHAIDCEEPRFGSKKEIGISVKICNVGDVPVVLPTKGICGVAFRSLGLYDLRFTDIGFTTGDGHPIVVSPSDLSLVELRPGEATFLEGHTIPKPAPLAVAITYEISADFARRYGTWHGKLQTQTVTIRASDADALKGTQPSDGSGRGDAE